jgi:hypothetical protein
MKLKSSTIEINIIISTYHFNAAFKMWQITLQYYSYDTTELVFR